MDFGIARAMATSVTMTQTAAVIGTAQYLSPEQARGEQVDARSDVYSTGCLLYELMTGRPPFVGDSPVTVALQHVREDPVAPSQFNRDIEPAIDAIVLKALAKHPGNRYQSADDMREDLLRAAAGRPVRATPVMAHDDATHVMAAAAPATTAIRRQDPVRPPEGRGKRGAGYVLLGIALVAIFVVAALLLNSALKSGNAAKATVPNLVGHTEADAVKLITGNKLVVGENKTQADNTGKFKKGVVISQSPTAATRLNEGDKVDLVISAGVANVEVPKIVGLPLEEAQAALKAAGLRLNAQVGVEEKADAQPNQVLRVDPVEGEQVPANSEVKLVVASGDLTVPQVTGLTLDKAQEQIEALGLHVRLAPEEYSDKPLRTVLKQSPAPKAKLKRGEIVLLTLSSGPSPSPSPSDTPPPPTDTGSPAPTDTATTAPPP
jgi:serine/threonine-protein kinase